MKTNAAHDVKTDNGQGKAHMANSAKTASTAARAARQAAKYIAARLEADAEGPCRLEELAAHCGLSPWHLQRQFRLAMGVTPRQYEDALRLERLKRGLRAGDGVADATFDAGFGSSSRVYERADAALGMTPASYAKGGKGAVIYFDIVAFPTKTALGLLMVAATARGLCRVALGDSEKTLADSLAAEFPKAERLRDPGLLGSYVRELLQRAAGAAPHDTLPLDIRMTAFQRQVWEALRRIPRGETRSYDAIAANIGAPRASRAVGRACASNPVALAIPCHRVLRKDGNLGGYAWGIERKQVLISAERRAREQTAEEAKN